MASVTPLPYQSSPPVWHRRRTRTTASLSAIDRDAALAVALAAPCMSSSLHPFSKRCGLVVALLGAWVPSAAALPSAARRQSGDPSSSSGGESSSTPASSSSSDSVPSSSTPASSSASLTSSSTSSDASSTAISSSTSSTSSVPSSTSSSITSTSSSDLPTSPSASPSTSSTSSPSTPSSASTSATESDPSTSIGVFSTSSFELPVSSSSTFQPTSTSTGTLSSRQDPTSASSDSSSSDSTAASSTTSTSSTSTSTSSTPTPTGSSSSTTASSTTASSTTASSATSSTTSSSASMASSASSSDTASASSSSDIGLFSSSSFEFPLSSSTSSSATAASSSPASLGPSSASSSATDVPPPSTSTGSGSPTSDGPGSTTSDQASGRPTPTPTSGTVQAPAGGATDPPGSSSGGGGGLRTTTLYTSIVETTTLPGGVVTTFTTAEPTATLITGGPGASSSAQFRRNTGAIVGTVLGSLVIVGAAALWLWLAWRRTRARQRDEREVLTFGPQDELFRPPLDDDGDDDDGLLHGQPGMAQRMRGGLTSTPTTPFSKAGAAEYGAIPHLRSRLHSSEGDNLMADELDDDVEDATGTYVDAVSSNHHGPSSSGHGALAPITFASAAVASSSKPSTPRPGSRPGTGQGTSGSRPSTSGSRHARASPSPPPIPPRLRPPIGPPRPLGFAQAGHSLRGSSPTSPRPSSVAAPRAPDSPTSRRRTSGSGMEPGLWIGGRASPVALSSTHGHYSEEATRIASSDGHGARSAPTSHGHSHADPAIASASSTSGSSSENGHGRSGKRKSKGWFDSKALPFRGAGKRRSTPPSDATHPPPSAATAAIAATTAATIARPASTGRNSSGRTSGRVSPELPRNASNLSSKSGGLLGRFGVRRPQSQRSSTVDVPGLAAPAPAVPGSAHNSKQSSPVVPTFFESPASSPVASSRPFSFTAPPPPGSFRHPNFSLDSTSSLRVPSEAEQQQQRRRSWAWPGLSPGLTLPPLPSPDVTERTGYVHEGLLRLGMNHPIGAESTTAISLRDNEDYTRPIGALMNNRMNSTTTVHTRRTTDTDDDPHRYSNDIS